MNSQLDKTDIQAYLESQSNLDTLRFITCGSVDDGKSTLIGRMLFDAKCLFDDQVSALQSESKKHGTQGQNIDFALLVDGLSAEREQGITIDVAYRFFATDKRKFIVADTPGHSEYTRNMATGASTASLAVILVDARHGIMEQTRRHTLICQLMGIRQIILAVNKMDLVHYKQTIFESICTEYNTFTTDMEFIDVTPIALSALNGENVTSRSGKMRWYHGPTLISKLETINVAPEETSNGFAFPVQLVNRPTADFRGFNGMVVRAPVKTGDKVLASPSGAASKVKHIWLAGVELKEAQPGLSVTIELENEIGISRGDVIASASHPVKISDQFEADIVWMSRQRGHAGRAYSLKLAGQNVTTVITSLKYQVDVNTGQKLASTTLNLNEISRITLNTQRPICFDDYGTTLQLGAFILIDSHTNETIAAGMIRFALRRATNIYRQQTDIDKNARRILNGHTSKVFWFTGLSGSGKSTIANEFANELHARGIRTYILDGDNVRHGLNKDLGFTDTDRIENIRRIGEVTKLMVDAGIVVLTAFISPFKAERDMVRSLFDEGEFVEVFVDTTLEVCEQRDVKGLYKKARAGEIPNFTGIDSQYEPPEAPDLTLHTDNPEFTDMMTMLLKKL